MEESTVFRHGKRAPSGTYRNDPFKNNSYWGGVDYGYLVNEGKVQMYNLGKWLRKRYKSFLPERYNNRDFIVYSSQVDRCLMSAAACAAGMFPPTDDDELWNRELRWQPIPVHAKTDDMIFQRIHCPRYSRMLREVWKGEEFSEVNRKNAEFYAYVSQMAGDKLRMLFGILMVQSAFDVPFPEWVNKSFDKMHRLARLEMVSHTYTPELTRLRLGPLVDAMINSFEAILEGSDNAHKFMFWSAHEGTLVNILNGMRIYDYHWPEFGATMLVELRKDDKRDVFINMLFKNSTKLSRLALNECGFACEYGRFKDLLAGMRMTMEEWERECFDGGR
ncbi:hypothetical protein NQ318_015071 [Aromia moschata]|uniref:acid phosphatase n=1 Tax=Aromia moschata TaxID=1265417 RepID=A0AAV8YW84_9CUCU|nr:hypothetical protein NQ318_015071 [Aromia moschata]